MIPQEDHPEVNFVGLIIGPRGNTLKTLEKDVSIFEIHSKEKTFAFVFFRRAQRSSFAVKDRSKTVKWA